MKRKNNRESVAIDFSTLGDPALCPGLPTPRTELIICLLCGKAEWTSPSSKVTYHYGCRKAMNSPRMRKATEEEHAQALAYLQKKKP